MVIGTYTTNMDSYRVKLSKASYDYLPSSGASVLRVTNVYGDEPVMYELRCGLG
jgi:hypothetical protein